MPAQYNHRMNNSYDGTHYNYGNVTYYNQPWQQQQQFDGSYGYNHTINNATNNYGYYNNNQRFAKKICRFYKPGILFFHTVFLYL